MLPHHERIAAEYEAGARDAKRERRRFAIWTIAICWTWVVVGGGLMGQGLHINATIGPFYFPRLMDRANALFSAGLFIGTAGPIATLLTAWRKASNRGILD